MSACRHRIWLEAPTPRGLLLRQAACTARCEHCDCQDMYVRAMSSALDCCVLLACATPFKYHRAVIRDAPWRSMPYNSAARGPSVPKVALDTFADSLSAPKAGAADADGPQLVCWAQHEVRNTRERRRRRPRN